VTFYYSIDYFFAKDQPYDFAEFDEMVENEEILNKQSDSILLAANNLNAKQEYFYFNPNTAKEKELIALGMNRFQINNLVKYRNRGGVFKQPKDLLKIYGIEKEYYNELEPFIIIEKKEKNYIIENSRDPKQSNMNDNPIEKVELNIATVDEIKSIIDNEILAKRIVKFRDLLGGFYSHAQLHEVYFMDSNSIDLLKDYSTIDLNQIAKMDVNTVEYTKLLQHPYIEKYEADAIFSYRKNGKIEVLQDLAEYKILDDNTFRKISYYIDIQ